MTIKTCSASPIFSFTDIESPSLRWDKFVQHCNITCEDFAAVDDDDVDYDGDANDNCIGILIFMPMIIIMIIMLIIIVLIIITTCTMTNMSSVLMPSLSLSLL